MSVVQKVKQIIVEILTKADIVDSMGEDTLELLRNVNPCLTTVTFDLGEPLATCVIKMFLEDVDHDRETFVVEHVRHGLSL